MTIGLSIRKRAISVALVVAMVVGFVLMRPSHTAAIPIPPTFVAALVQALPSIATVVGKLFNPTDKKAKPTPTQKTAIDSMTSESKTGKDQLAVYAQREQVIWRLVSSSSQVSRGVSVMTAVVSDKTTLTEAEVADLNRDLTFIKAGVDSIVKSAPSSKLFVPDTVQVTAIEGLLTNAPPAVASIGEDLKYNKDADTEKALVKNLHKDLDDLDKVFKKLDEATAAEIEMIAEGLSAVSAPTQPAPTDKNAIKAAADVSAKAAFGNVSALDLQIGLANQDFKEALQKFEQKEQKF
jgi:hypothetical protein